jgi:hypothetical protein
MYFLLSVFGTIVTIETGPRPERTAEGLGLPQQVRPGVESVGVRRASSFD